MSLIILKSIIEKTVFTFKELTLLFPDIPAASLKKRLNYYTKQGQLYHIRTGLYGKNNNYNKLEVADKIFTPAYISFETVLRSAGVIFQYYFLMNLKPLNQARCTMNILWSFIKIPTD